MDNTKKQLKSVYELMEEVEDIAIHINELPDLIQLLIENNKLDQGEWSSNDEYDFIRSRDNIYSILTLIQRILWETKDAFDALHYVKEAQTEEATTPTKVEVAN